MRIFLAVAAIAVLLFVGPLSFSQQPPASQSPTSPLSAADVEHGLRAGVSNTRMAALVKQYGVDFELTDAAEKQLRSAGASDQLLLGISRSRRPSDTADTPSTTPQQNTIIGDQQTKPTSGVTVDTDSAHAPEVLPSTAVITMNGFCDDLTSKPKPTDCRTVINRAEFERIRDAVQPKMSTGDSKKLAISYANAKIMSAKASAMRLDQTPDFEVQIKFARMQILAKQLNRSLPESNIRAAMDSVVIDLNQSYFDATAADVASQDAVITITGVCDRKSSAAAVVGDCRTVTNRSDFDALRNALKASTGDSKKIATNYAHLVILSAKARELGLDRGAAFEEQVGVARTQILAKQLRDALPEPQLQTLIGSVTVTLNETYFSDSSTNTQTPPPPGRPAEGWTAVIDTTVGNLNCTLFPDQAPIGVGNFIGLAAGTKDWINPVNHRRYHGVPLYDGTIIHRVIPDFMIQGGDPKGDGTGDPGYKFKNEVSSDLLFDKPGRLAYANSGPDTNGSQFFITEVATPHLNGNYSVFGQCDDNSVELVKRIARMPRGADDRPYRPVKINHITILRTGNGSDIAQTKTDSGLPTVGESWNSQVPFQEATVASGSSLTVAPDERAGTFQGGTTPQSYQSNVAAVSTASGSLDAHDCMQKTSHRNSLVFRNTCSRSVHLYYCETASGHACWSCASVGIDIRPGDLSSDDYSSTIGAVCHTQDCSDLDTVWNATYVQLDADSRPNEILPRKPNVDDSCNKIAH